MAIKTTYTCDRCGHAQDDAEQMWSVGVTYSHGHGRLEYIGGKSTYGAALWCRACMQHLGILGPHQAQVEDAAAKPAPAPPSLEDLIREIAREEIAARTGA
jgi:hypothetical protein